MKPLPKILLALTAVAALSLFSVQLAQAYSVTLEQVGSDVVATGSGPLDLTGLTLVVTYASLPAQIFPVLGQIVTGSGGATDGYQGSISGPTSIGGVFFTFASLATQFASQDSQAEQTETEQRNCCAAIGHPSRPYHEREVLVRSSAQWRAWDPQ